LYHLRTVLGWGFAAAVTVVCVLTFSLQQAPAQEANAEEGASLFKSKCRACHDIGPNAKDKVGPVLNGIVGRKAGTVEGFGYSPANKKAGADGLVWTEDVLSKYLIDPRSFMPKTTMAFVGLKDEQDRKDLIAFLKAQSMK